VVPLTGAPDLLDLRHTLESRVATPDGLPVHLKAFTWWMLGRTGWECPLLAEIAPKTGAARIPSHIAAAGMAYRSLGGSRCDLVYIREGLEWLSRREFFVPHGPLQLERDGVAVLGLAFAVQSLGAVGYAVHSWLYEFITKFLEALAPGTWDGSLALAGQVVLDPTRCGSALPSMRPDISVALVAKGLISNYGVNGEAAWQAVATMDGLDEGPAQAAVLLAAFDRLLADSLPARLANIQVEDVCRIVQNLPTAMRRWTWDDKPKTPRSKAARWEVENEYHVQNMLWAIMAPLFPDLDDEDYIESIGQKHPRYDLAIPSLGLIIEVKFIRPGVPFSSVIGEIAEDVTLYLRAGRGWRYLIPVVWDDSCRTEEHHEFLGGLRKMQGVVEAVVISRPAKMLRQTPLC
jgi:hypothetical protein